MLKTTDITHTALLNATGWIDFGRDEGLLFCKGGSQVRLDMGAGIVCVHSGSVMLVNLRNSMLSSLLVYELAEAGTHAFFSLVTIDPT